MWNSDGIFLSLQVVWRLRVDTVVGVGKGILEQKVYPAFCFKMMVTARGGGEGKWKRAKGR